jgi:Nif-specific regulatory protein
MPTDRSLAWLDSQPRVARQLLALGAESTDVVRFWRSALAAVTAALPARSAALMLADSGSWRVLAACGPEETAPWELLSNALDRNQVIRSENWIAAPFPTSGVESHVLAVRLEPGPGEGVEQSAAALADLLPWLANPVRDRERQRARTQRLEAILAIAGQWNRTLDLDQLLTRMAEESTRLLNAERASIFVWDRKAHLLIGRPALGVAGGELQISDTQGVVGQVVQSGEPRRVGSADERGEIDHSVDEQLKFRTRSLLCVPLFGSDGAVCGAFELLNKAEGDFTADDEVALTELARHAAIALENSRQHEKLQRSRDQVATQAAARIQLIGDCPAVCKLRQSIERVAATELAVLILGENGTGKEVVAQMIHYLSARRQEPFVAVNCAALPDTLLESELFGHEKGAFTDARQARQGKFELASGGTLLLDEIGDLSLPGQAKLLRVLEEKVVVRVGGSNPIPTDARVLAATNHDLAELVHQKKFRQDLFFRLTVVTLNLPPLRERGEDALRLAEFFLGEFAIKARRPGLSLTSAAAQRILAHPWPGNVRELRNLMERLAYLANNDRIDADDLSFMLTPSAHTAIQPDGERTLSDATRQFQINYIQSQIDRARGNMTDAAERLGLHRSNLYRKMNQLGMQGE